MDKTTKNYAEDEEIQRAMELSRKEVEKDDLESAIALAVSREE